MGTLKKLKIIWFSFDLFFIKTITHTRDEILTAILPQNSFTAVLNRFWLTMLATASPRVFISLYISLKKSFTVIQNVVMVLDFDAGSANLSVTRLWPWPIWLSPQAEPNNWGKRSKKEQKKKDILDEKNEIKYKDMADETTILPLFLEDSSIRFLILPQVPNWSS